MKVRYTVLLILVAIAITFSACLIFLPTRVTHSQSFVVIDLLSGDYSEFYQSPGLSEKEIKDFVETTSKDFYYQVIPAPDYILNLFFDYEQSPELLDLAFSLVDEESKFKPWATNENKNSAGVTTSTDRGLFQLNDRSYPGLTIGQMYHLETNIETGLKHLRTALKNQKGDARLALYEYNAGKSKVSNPPERTVTYAAQVLQKALVLKYDRVQYVRDKFKERFSM